MMLHSCYQSTLANPAKGGQSSAWHPRRVALVASLFWSSAAGGGADALAGSVSPYSLPVTCRVAQLAPPPQTGLLSTLDGSHQSTTTVAYGPGMP